MLKGIDISEYQPNVDFNVLKSQIDFVIIRASYGNGYVDKSFATHKLGARSVNLPCGFYHYAYPQYNDAEAEADWFLQTVGTPETGEILCLDFEENWSGDIPGWCAKFLDRLSLNLGGYKGLIYLNQNLIQHNDWSRVVNSGYGLWVASYDSDPNSVHFNTPWPSVFIKQYSDAGIVSGVSNKVDVNTFFGDLSSLQNIGFHLSQPFQSIPEPSQPETTSNNSNISDQNPNTNIERSTNQIFFDSLKSRKLILALLASLTTFLNSIFNLNLTQNELVLFLLPILAFIIVEGLADIMKRSK